jgi:hypothetical protein
MSPDRYGSSVYLSPALAEAGRHSSSDVKLALPGVAQRLARVAHNHEVIRSKRIAGIYHHIAMVHRGTGATLTPLAQRQSTQAHNLGVTRSKRVGGIIQFASFTEAGRHMLSDVKHSTLTPP